MLQIRTIPVGMLGTNCYLAWLPEETFLYVIDPGADADTILAAARKYPFTRAAILLTHAHVDHITALGAVRRGLGDVPVYLNPADETLYRSPDNALEPYMAAASDLPETVTDLPEAPGLRILPAPGHSRGGSLFYFPADGVLFSGDTLFAGSIGRTDFPGGSTAEIVRSLHKLVETLPEETEVFPGHDASTTIGYEKRYNPFV